MTGGGIRGRVTGVRIDLDPDGYLVEAMQLPVVRDALHTVAEQVAATARTMPITPTRGQLARNQPAAPMGRVWVEDHTRPRGRPEARVVTAPEDGLGRHNPAAKREALRDAGKRHTTSRTPRPKL